MLGSAVGQTILAQAAGPQRNGTRPRHGRRVLSWRWIFFINRPIGVAALVAADRLLPEAKAQLGQRLDVFGLLLLLLGIALFLSALARAGGEGGFI